MSDFAKMLSMYATDPAMMDESNEVLGLDTEPNTMLDELGAFYPNLAEERQPSLRGLANAAGMIGTQIPMTIAGGLKGLAALLSGAGVDEAANQIERYQNAAWAPEDPTEAIKVFNEIQEFPLVAGLEWLSEQGGELGYEYGGPLGGALGEIGPDLLDFAVGSKGALTNSKMASLLALKRLDASADISRIKPDHELIQATSYGNRHLPVHTTNPFSMDPLSPEGAGAVSSHVLELPKGMPEDAIAALFQGEDALISPADLAELQRNGNLRGTMHGNIEPRTVNNDRDLVQYTTGTDLDPDLHGMGIGSQMYKNWWNTPNEHNIPVFSDELVSGSARKVYDRAKADGSHHILKEDPNYNAMGDLMFDSWGGLFPESRVGLTPRYRVAQGADFDVPSTHVNLEQATRPGEPMHVVDARPGGEGVAGLIKGNKAAAQELGFDVDRVWHHGTMAEFDAFDDNLWTHMGTKQAAEDLTQDKWPHADPEDLTFHELFTRTDNPLKLPGEPMDFDDPRGVASYMMEMSDDFDRLFKLKDNEYADVGELRRRWGEESNELRQTHGMTNPRPGNMPDADTLTKFNKADRSLRIKQRKEFNEWMNKHGYDAIDYVNEVEDPGSVSRIITDPSRIRSIDAEFNPAAVGSSNLNASLLDLLLGDSERMV